jgi:hypothetical protein
MYPVSADFDIATLHGRVVEMICVTAYSFYVHLTEHVTITVGGEYALLDAGQTDPVVGSPAASDLDARLFRLIEATLETAEFDAQSNLSLSFSNGLSLQLLNCPAYESFEITISGRRMIF